MSNIITPGVGRAGTSQKITVTIFSTESKKLWLVSHKSRVFVFQKYFGHPPFWTFIGHVAYMLRKWQHFTQCPKWGYVRNGWMGARQRYYMNMKIFQFQTKYFRLKSVFHIISDGSNQDFYNYNSGFRIQNFEFQTEYFRLKSVFSNEFLWFQPVLLQKRNINPTNELFISIRLFRSNSKYNIARYYIIHYSTREWPSWVF